MKKFNDVYGRVHRLFKNDIVLVSGDDDALEVSMTLFKAMGLSINKKKASGLIEDALDELFWHEEPYAVDVEVRGLYFEDDKLFYIVKSKGKEDIRVRYEILNKYFNAYWGVGTPNVVPVFMYDTMTGEIDPVARLEIGDYGDITFRRGYDDEDYIKD